MPSRRTFLATSAAALVAGAAGCGGRPPPPADDFDRPDDRWPTAGYDPAGTANPPTGPGEVTVQWTRRRRAVNPRMWGFLTTPIVADGAVYVAGLAPRWFEPGEDGTVLAALDAGTGEVNWAVAFDQGLSGGPALADGAVVVGDRGGTISALREGTVVWEATVDASVGTPTVYGGRLYVPDGAGNLHAFGRDGSHVWTADRVGLLSGLLGGVEPVAAGVPAADEAGVYATFEARERGSGVAHLVAYDHGGGERWSHELRGRRFGNGPRGPAVAGGTVYATAGGNVHAVDASTGEERWRFVTGYESAGPPATDGDRVYVAAKNCYALDVDDGTERWRLVEESLVGRSDDQRGLPFLARPAVADGAVYLRAGAVDAETGERRWGDDADGWLESEDFYEDPYRRRPMARPALTADALYLSHAHWGVRKYA